MSKRILNPRERVLYGVTVTICERTTGEQKVIVVTDTSVMPALKEVVAQIDELEGVWYVQSISTPETIFTDLAHGGRGQGRGFQSPEKMFLGRIRRLDLLETRPTWAMSDGRRAMRSGGT